MATIQEAELKACFRYEARLEAIRKRLDGMWRAQRLLMLKWISTVMGAGLFGFVVGDYHGSGNLVAPLVTFFGVFLFIWTTWRSL